MLIISVVVFKKNSYRTQKKHKKTLVSARFSKNGTRNLSILQDFPFLLTATQSPHHGSRFYRNNAQNTPSVSGG